MWEFWQAGKCLPLQPSSAPPSCAVGLGPHHLLPQTALGGCLLTSLPALLIAGSLRSFV